MDPRVRYALLTATAIAALGLAWWVLGPRPADPGATPATAPAPTTTAAAPAPAPEPADEVEATDEAEDEDAEAARREAVRQQQHLGRIPGLAGRDGTDPEVQRELLDRIERMEAERLGPEAAAERRRAREQQLQRRIEEATNAP